MSSESLRAAIDDFLLAKEIEGRAARTIQFYRIGLLRFATFAGAVAPAGVDALLLRRWLQSLAAEGLSSTTQARYLTTVKTWLRWCALEGDYATDRRVLERVKTPRLDTEQPHPFTDAEVVRLFGACSTTTWLGIRHRALLAVMLDAGLRVGEVCGLRLVDVDHNSGDLRVRAATSKSRQERTVTLGRRALREVRRYGLGPRARGETRLDAPYFIGRYQRGMVPNTIYAMLSSLGKRAGVPDAHPHRCRHTYAINCLKAGMSPFALMTSLGHSDLAMTRRYINLVSADIRDEQRQKSPLDHMKGRL